MLEGTLLKLFSFFCFGVGINTQISGGGRNLKKKVPHIERLLIQLIRVEKL